MSYVPKYIVVRAKGDSKEHCVLFDGNRSHDVMFRQAAFALDLEPQAVSAGFVDFDVDKATNKTVIHCSGYSATLDVGARDGDGQLLTESLLTPNLRFTLYGSQNRPSLLASSFIRILHNELMFAPDVLLHGEVSILMNGNDMQATVINASEATDVEKVACTVKKLISRLLF